MILEILMRLIIYFLVFVSCNIVYRIAYKRGYKHGKEVELDRLFEKIKEYEQMFPEFKNDKE